MKIMFVHPPNAGRSIPEEEYGITSIRQIFRGEPFSLEVLAAFKYAYMMLPVV
jgi:hopanoid C-3 methylase